MFCSRTSNNLINKTHEPALRLILSGHTSDFDTLFQNNNKTCNHHRNIQTMMVEIYKMKNDLNPLIMDFIFEKRNKLTDLCNYGQFCMKT